MSEFYANTIGVVQSWLFEHAVQPMLFSLDMIALDEMAFQATEWLVLGMLEIALLYAMLRPLEARYPMEEWSDRRGVGVDVLYTFLQRLGFVPVAFFLLISPAMDTLEGWLRLRGFEPYNLEDLVPLIGHEPLLAFLVYLVVLDLAEYVRHRLQHKFDWWWALHSLHHSQRKMSFWTDSRNHLLDDVLASAWIASIAIVIGVPPGQFFLILVATRMLENLSHANLRVSFGSIGERLIVSPHFHRLHHGIGVGHEGVHRGCNFGVLFPLWDLVFRTASFSTAVQPTGVRDQLEGRDYGEGFWAQQWFGLRRLVTRRNAVRAPQSISAA